MSCQTECGEEEESAFTSGGANAEAQQAALDNERAQWREMIEESEERCRALIEHLTMIQNDEERVIKLLTNKVSALTEERNAAQSRLLALSSSTKSPRNSHRRSSGSSPRSSPRSTCKPLPSLPEHDINTNEHEHKSHGEDDNAAELHGTLTDAGNDSDEASVSATPAPPLEELMCTPPSSSVPSECLPATPARYTPTGQPAAQPPAPSTTSAVSASPVVVRTPEKGSGSGGEENLSDEDRDDANFFHRFFSQPDFDSSVAAWIKLQAFDQMLDVAPQAVGTWINTELPWERKEDKPQSFEEGFMKLFFF